MSNIAAIKGPVQVVAKHGLKHTHGKDGEELGVCIIEGALWVTQSKSVLGVYAPGEWIGVLSD